VRWLALLALLVGCVFADATPQALLDQQCALCAEDQACDHGECTASCEDDAQYESIYAPCVSDAYVCYLGECVKACVPEECPGGFDCSKYFDDECEDFCTNDNDCRSGWRCCQSSSDGCDFGECYRR
jgi:hypothetical protein